MTKLTPIQLEVLWNRLLSVANEQQATLMRTAFSTITRELQDLAQIGKEAISVFKGGHEA